MKIHINKWLGCGLALIMMFGLGTSINHVSANRAFQRTPKDLTIQPVSKIRNQSNKPQTKASIYQITIIPNQGYTNYVTGQNALFSLPGTVRGSRIVYSRRAMHNFANQKVRFMTYQRAVTSQGLVYYKIVSLHHSVRGWMYQSAIRSMLNRHQQAADFTFGSQITHAEMVADQSKHESLVNRSKVDLTEAQQLMNEAESSVRDLKGTPDYQPARASIQSGRQYLEKIRTVEPNAKTLLGLVTIRSEYKKASQAVSAAQRASLNHHSNIANREIKVANQSLRHVNQILNQIHNRRDRRVAMNLFNHALSYVNSNFSFDPAKQLNGRNLNSQKMSNSKIVDLISQYEDKAQSAIMDLYPNLNNFDESLMDAYQAQSDLNQANDLVTNLRGVHIRKAELSNVELNQHNINDLWNV